MVSGKWPFKKPLQTKLIGLNLSVIEVANSSHRRPGSDLGAMPPTGSKNCGAQSPSTLTAPSEPIIINSRILIKFKSLSKLPLPKAELQMTSRGNSLSLGICGCSEFPAPAQAVPVDFQLRLLSRGCCESLSSPCSCTGQSHSSSLQFPIQSTQTNPKSAQAITGFMNNRASCGKHQLQMQIHCCLLTLQSPFHCCLNFPVRGLDTDQYWLMEGAAGIIRQDYQSLFCPSTQGAHGLGEAWLAKDPPLLLYKKFG